MRFVTEYACTLLKYPSKEPCGAPSVCGLRHKEGGFIVNVCRKHFKEMTGRKFGSKPGDMQHYREQHQLFARTEKLVSPNPP